MSHFVVVVKKYMLVKQVLSSKFAKERRRRHEVSRQLSNADMNSFEEIKSKNQKLLSFLFK